MKLMRKLAAGVTALALCAGMAASLGTALPAAAVDDCNDDWLHAVGSRLYDSEGNEVWLTGANWFGFNCSENCAHGMYAADCDEFLKSVADHGINIVRMPISTELLVSWMEGTPNPVQSVQASYEPPVDEVGEDGTVTKAGTYGNINKDFVESDGKTLKNSLEIFDVMMQKMKKYGLKVVVDVHSPLAHNSGHNYNLWYYEATEESSGTMAVRADGHEMSYDDWKDSITWLAERYANDDTIIGYDLKNEPHGKRGYDGTTCPSSIARWDDSKEQNNWAYAATECGLSILNVNPNALILIEGVEQYPKTEKGYTYDTADIWQASAEVSPWYGAWWGGNLRGVKEYPIDFGSAALNSKIVYSPHDYGPSVYEQTWFYDGFTTQTLLDDYWYATWAYINDQDIAPLLIGEWGGFPDGGKNQQWMELLRDYMLDNHINHTFWGLNPNSGDTGGLLGYDFKTWDDARYEILEKALWQTASSGKFIGLDHQTPLGGEGSTTGISVAEYYKTYAASEGSNLDAGGSKEPQQPSTVETKESSETTETTAKASEDITTTSTEATATSGETTETTPSAAGGTEFGDVDENGAVELLDVILLNKSLLGVEKLTTQAQQNADVDQNNKLDSADSLYILQYTVSLVTELPVRN